MIGIQIASNYEWTCLKQLFEISQTSHYPYGEYFYYSIADELCLFYKGGVRKTKSAGACQYMISEHHLTKLYLIGSCGGVDPSLRVLDLIMATQTVHYDAVSEQNSLLILDSLTIQLEINHQMREELFGEVHFGALATADKPLLEMDKALQLNEVDVLGADCESAAVATICQLNQIECYIIRGITDFPIQLSDGQIDSCQKYTPIILQKIVNLILPKIITLR